MLAEQCRQRGFAPVVMALDCYPIERLPNETLAIFLVSTTGDGEPPSNMIRFWRFHASKGFARRFTSKASVCSVRFGDSSYVKFNAAARRLRVRLKQLSATEMVTIGLGDDQNDMVVEVMFDKWSRSLWDCLGSCILFLRNSSLGCASKMEIEELNYIGSKKEGRDG